MSHYFQAKKIWITGASSGIGLACAEMIAKAKPAALILSGRDVARLQQLAASIHSCAVLVLPFDVTDRSVYAECVQKIISFCGGVDIAFFNAGGSEHESSRKFQSSLYERAMALNYFSLVYGIEAVLPLLRASKTGHLVGMSSMAAFLGVPQAQAYAAAKAAARLCLEGLRAELWHEGIAVTTICPGFVATPLVAKNKFHMPFLMSPSRAARIILCAIARKQAECVFPRRMRWLVGLVKRLPLAWYARWTERMLR